MSAQGASGLPLAVVLLSGGALLPLLVPWELLLLELEKALGGAEGLQEPGEIRGAVNGIAALISRIGAIEPS